jgi:hypothetical protein
VHGAVDVRASATLETKRFDVNVLEIQLAHGLAKERGLSDPCLDQRQAHVWQHDLQGQRRGSTARSDVDDHAIAIAHVGRGKNWFDDQSVDRVIHRAIEVKRREVDATIPAGEKRQISRERGRGSSVDANTRDAETRVDRLLEIEHGHQTAARRLDNLAATMATAAGVTPGTREA